MKIAKTKDKTRQGRNMIKDFNDLEVWQQAKKLVIAVYGITKGFPREELFSLTDQLKRAANSVCANIAEGFSRYHRKDKIKFYYNARGSVSEVKSHIFVAKELNYLSSEVADGIVLQYDSVNKMLNGMINSLSRFS